jgi:hypothetical protein
LTTPSQSLHASGWWHVKDSAAQMFLPSVDAVPKESDRQVVHTSHHCRPQPTAVL